MTRNFTFYNCIGNAFTLKVTDAEWMFIDVKALSMLGLLNECQPCMLLYTVKYIPHGVDNPPILDDYVKLEQYTIDNPYVNLFQVFVTQD
jgi:hypothetical protein